LTTNKATVTRTALPPHGRIRFDDRVNEKFTGFETVTAERSDKRFFVSMAVDHRSDIGYNCVKLYSVLLEF
jgi:hypothetical protein